VGGAAAAEEVAGGGGYSRHIPTSEVKHGSRVAPI
jgi:hypothetical protein